jgi:hypothetical protein
VTGRAALIDGTGVEAAFAEPTGLALHSLNGNVTFIYASARQPTVV